MSQGFAKLGLSGAARAVAANELSPVDLARLCVEQYDAVESSLHAWTSFDRDQLLRQAAALADIMPTGPLFGQPIGVKDIFNTNEFPTQKGSALWQGFTPGNDARAVFHLTRAGALVAGKTVTAEFAVHALGETRNPFDLERTPGTSSSGSAVAVAAGVVPAALGTQTAGSIIRPASFCGVYGFKPSFGLIPRTGTLKTTDSLDTIGYFVPHAADLQPMLDALRVRGADYPNVDRAFGDSTGGLPPRAGPWRVAIVRGPAWDDAEPYAQQALIDFGQQLERADNVEMVEVTLPEDIDQAHAIHATIYDASLAYYFKDETDQAAFVSPIMNEIVAHGRTISGESYRAALIRQEQMCRAMDACFDGVDIILTLSTAGVAPHRAQRETRDSALVWTLLHLPALSAPVFRDAGGLPFGLQVVARRYGDARLIEFVTDMVTCGLLPERSQFPEQLSSVTGQKDAMAVGS